MGARAPAATHFRKVTASYWPGLFACYWPGLFACYGPGLFACYDVPDRPRTTNDLEHSFGTSRHLERRATGRKGASPAVVVRGAVRVVAAVAT